MKDLTRDYVPNIIILFETKVPLQSLGNIFVQFGLTEASFSDPVGRVSSIWVLWNPNMVKIQTI